MASPALSTPGANGSGRSVAEEEADGALAVRSCQWLDPAGRDQLLAALDASSDVRISRRALEGDAAVDSLMASGESLLVLPEKAMLLRPTGIGGSIGGLAFEFETDSTCITRLYTCMHALPRACLFVGDIVLAVDDEEVRSASELLEMLDEKPSGVPITLRLRQPALATALSERGTQSVRFASWVCSPLPLGSRSDPRAAGRRATERLDAMLSRRSDDADEGCVPRYEEEEVEESVSGGAASKGGGGVTEADWMALLVLCGQRIRLVQLEVVGTRRGVLRPERVGMLEKQGEPGRLTFHKWRTRQFELRAGSLYYYDPEDLKRPKGVVPLTYRGVEILSEGHRESADPLVFVVCTPSRNYCLRAPDTASKDAWVEALRAHVGQPEAALRHLEVISPMVREDVHLLDLYSLSSSDNLRNHLSLTLAPGMSGGGGGGGYSYGATGESGSGSASHSTLSITSPLARQTALQLQGAWQRLTTFMGTPLRGCERTDRWLQPRSELPALPMLMCDLVWRTGVDDDECAFSLPEPRGEMGLSGWVRTKPQTEGDVPWRHASVQRRFCVLSHDALRCYATEADAAKAAADAAKMPAADAESGAVTMALTTPIKPAAATPGAPSSRRTSFAPPAAAPLALTTIELCRVTRVRPCADPTAAAHAFELRSLGAGGHELTVVFEPPGGHEGSDRWLGALARSLPAAAFESARAGRLGWNVFADPLLPDVTACTHHPLSVMAPADELASGLLTLADWRGVQGCERAAAALRLATTGGASVAVDLCQRHGHYWSELELSLLLVTLMHNTRVCALRLQGFALGVASSATSRALASLLERSACLESLQLCGCTFDDASLGVWTSAIESNPKLPLRSIALQACHGLPRSCGAAGRALSHMFRTLPSALVELDLDGAGITGWALREVLDALHRHDRRFFTLRSLQRLTLSSDTIDERRACASLCSLLRRAGGLRQLSLLRADRHGPGGETGGGWLRPTSTGLAPVLEALHASAPPLERLSFDGCGVASGDELASLGLLRVSARFDQLTHLSLGGTRMPVDAICAAVAILVHNPTRPALSLDCSRNQLGFVGGLKLAAVLRGAVSLKALEAADNEFGAGGVCALADTLRGVSSLTSLGLARNVRTPPRRAPERPASPPTVAEDDAACEGGTTDLDLAEYKDVDARRAFRAIGRLLSDRRCALCSLDISGEPSSHAVPDEQTALLLALAQCETLTSVDVSGHLSGSSPGLLGAMLHLLRKSRSLRDLAIHRNGLDSASLRAVLGGWRRRNLTLRRLTLFAADPRDVPCRIALAHETASPKLAAELIDEAELISSRNRRLAEAVDDVEGMAAP